MFFRTNSGSGAGGPKDAHLCARIQVEFDAFVLRACRYIYKSRSLGTWQYLAILPFSDVCIGTLWRLYGFLVTGASIDENFDATELTKVLNADFLLHFNDTVVDVQADDMYYLLQTFSSMAMAQLKDMEFVDRITMDLFEVFITTILLLITLDNKHLMLL